MKKTITHHPKHLTKGFTLIEVMVAMAIFAVLSLMAYGGLDAVIKNKTRTDIQLKRLHQLQMTMLNFHRDFEQLASRDGHDEFGSTLLKLTNQNNDLLVDFTRSGWRNPAKLQRSSLQRVAYKLDENSLYRLSWPYVDRAQDDRVVETLLIDNIEDVTFRFLNDNNEWKNDWPDANAIQGNINQPKAIEIKLLMNDWGEIVRLFKVLQIQ
jgi:general secretion pathway protein J